MSVPRLTPEEAARLLRDEGYAYVDVRTEEEFCVAHPEGAYNVPWQHLAATGREHNAEFLRVVRASFAPGAKLVVGCQQGNRSRAAAAALADAGFVVVEQRAGFGGVRDPFGRVTERGWEALGLPVASDVLPGRSYAELRARAGLLT